MRISWTPTTVLGRISAYCLLGGLVSLALFFAFVLAGEKGGETFFSNLRLAIPYSVTAITGIAAFGLGLSAVMWRGERSVAVIVSTTLGMLALLWVGAELLSSH